MNKFILTSCMCLMGLWVWGQNQTGPSEEAPEFKKFILGIAPQYVGIQAVRLDLEIQSPNGVNKLKSMRYSPFIYKGYNYQYESNTAGWFTFPETAVSGVGAEVTWSRGTRMPYRGLTISGEAGLGYHFIALDYTDEVWVNLVDEEGLEYTVLRESDVKETVRRGDLFFQVAARKELIDFNGPSFTVFMGTSIRFADIRTTAAASREHRGILNHGTEGIMFRMGLILEGVIGGNRER